MLINSRAVALLLASCICAVTVAFLSLVEGTSSNALFVAGSLAFSSSFLLIYVSMEFLIFKEINKIYSGLGKGQREELQQYSQTLKLSSNPIRRVKQEISNYTRIKEKEIDELKRLEAYRREFLANVSHELKTPIFAAQGYILTLLDGAMDDERVRYKFLKKAAKSLNGLDALVQDLLTLSQIESGVITMHYENFDLEMLVNDVFEQLENKARKRSITFKIDKQTTGQSLTVYADYNRIMQVFINLINNAIKYGSLKGWIKVGFQESAQHIEISVADNGPGIPEEHLGRVFERFYRVEKSRSKKQGGTGLGLAIVKHILEGHGSKISVTSQLNEGSCFTFRLQKGKNGEETPPPQRTDRF
jgi:two-component system phosphate regulon sensor histidine kinase PhoR